MITIRIPDELTASPSRMAAVALATEYEVLQAAANALASVPAAPNEVIEALHYVDDVIARCNGNDRGSCESVNGLRRALSAPAAHLRGWPGCAPVGVSTVTAS